MTLSEATDLIEEGAASMQLADLPPRHPAPNAKLRRHRDRRQARRASRSAITSRVPALAS